ncbi:MAG TPA: FMN-binding protein [Candidatus Saccharimonadales bacterium]|nr:FMN-binding protein [Candidatus Saccharimonadales bacterium]
MKRILLSTLLIVTFAVYVFHKKFENEDTVVIQNPTPVPTSTTVVNPYIKDTQSTSSAATSSHGKYKDGTYTGSAVDAFYGIVQVRATISNSKISDVKFLQYPNDRDTSREISSQSTPVLRQEAINSQSANVDIVSGATQTSEAFIQSMKFALDQAL